MKKILFVLPVILLLLAGCAHKKQVETVPQTLNTIKPEPQATTTIDSNNRTFKPVQTDCANYSNHGISFSCPDGFYLNDYTDASGNTELTFFNKNKTYSIEEGSAYAVYIGISKDTYNNSIDDFLKKDPQSVLDKKITLGESPAYILKCKPNAYYCQKQEVVFENGKVYQFINSTEFASETLPVYNSIVSSVQFTQ